MPPGFNMAPGASVQGADGANFANMFNQSAGMPTSPSPAQAQGKGASVEDLD